MIEHLKGREKQLEDLGWKGQDAEWIALVCLHSGTFIRSQYAAWRGTSHMSAMRLVHRLFSAKVAVEETVATISQTAKLVRIFSRPLYEALGIKDVRHRKSAGRDVLLRRLLSLDYVIEYLPLPWLPTEPEKVRFCEQLGIPSNLLPRKIYGGSVNGTVRYFSVKMPIAAGQDSSTFLYIDTEDVTDKGLRTWGSAHLPLWEKLRENGIRIRVVAVSRSLHRLERCERLLKQWAEASAHPRGAEQREEIERINRAIADQDEVILAEYGGLSEAIRFTLELEKSAPKGSSAAGGLIDAYGVWRADRVAAVHNEQKANEALPGSDNGGP